MKIIVSRRALADLDKIETYYTKNASLRVSRMVEQRIFEVVDHISRAPQSAPLVSRRRGTRVVPVVKFPFRIFYRYSGETLEILHIRHTSRRA
jgi:toxin ParE1/3/4